MVHLTTSCVTECTPLIGSMSAAYGECFEFLWVGPRKTVIQAIDHWKNGAPAKDAEAKV